MFLLAANTSLADAVLGWTLRGCAAVSAAILLLVVGFLLYQAAPALASVGGWRLFADPGWHPASDATTGEFGIIALLAGSLFVTAGAALVATPLAIASAIFCRYVAPPPLATAYRRMLEVLAGIPSVVYGFWGLVALVPIISSLHPPGASLLAGALVLGLMILPTIALLTDSALASVPQATVSGAAALGLSRWRIALQVALPAARGGVVTGIILGVARAVGETMAVLMVCGNVVQVPDSVFEPVRTLTANIALEMAYAFGDHRSALFLTGLVLTLLVIVIVLLAETASNRSAAPRPATEATHG